MRKMKDVCTVVTPICVGLVISLLLVMFLNQSIQVECMENEEVGDKTIELDRIFQGLGTLRSSSDITIVTGTREMGVERIQWSEVAANATQNEKLQAVMSGVKSFGAGSLILKEHDVKIYQADVTYHIYVFLHTETLYWKVTIAGVGFHAHTILLLDYYIIVCIFGLAAAFAIGSCHLGKLLLKPQGKCEGNGEKNSQATVG